MAEKTSVMTPERFASGFTYQDYLAQIKVNKDRFEKYYESVNLSADDAAFFKRVAEAPNGAPKMMVIGEDWCPDVYRGMPVMARIAEAAGMEMRIFPRDEHLDIMNEFLNHGEFISIPVAVFYTKEMDAITHWIERPVIANEDIPRITEETKQAMPNADEQEYRRAAREKMQARYSDWQQASIKEMRKMLADKLGL